VLDKAAGTPHIDTALKRMALRYLTQALALNPSIETSFQILTKASVSLEITGPLDWVAFSRHRLDDVASSHDVITSKGS